MTEPKLCPTTLRWAAGHIRKFMKPTPWGISGDRAQILAYANDAYELCAESLERWATEAELVEAKRKATALVLEPALTVDYEENYRAVDYDEAP